MYDLGTLKEVWAFRIIPVRSAQKLAKTAIRFPQFLEYDKINSWGLAQISCMGLCAVIFELHTHL